MILLSKVTGPLATRRRHHPRQSSADTLPQPGWLECLDEAREGGGRMGGLCGPYFPAFSRMFPQNRSFLRFSAIFKVFLFSKTTALFPPDFRIFPHFSRNFRKFSHLCRPHSLPPGCWCEFRGGRRFRVDYLLHFQLNPICAFWSSILGSFACVLISGPFQDLYLLKGGGYRVCIHTQSLHHPHRHTAIHRGSQAPFPRAPPAPCGHPAARPCCASRRPVPTSWTKPSTTTTLDRWPYEGTTDPPTFHRTSGVLSRPRRSPSNSAALHGPDPNKGLCSLLLASPCHLVFEYGCHRALGLNARDPLYHSFNVTLHCKRFNIHSFFFFFG